MHGVTVVDFPRNWAHAQTVDTRIFLPIPQEPGYMTSYAWPVEDVTAVLPALAIDRDEVIYARLCNKGETFI